MAISKDVSEEETGEARVENSVSPAPATTTAPGPAKKTARKTAPKTRKEFVVSGQDTDEVVHSKLVRNERARKSLSVHHLQRRLSEWGYSEAIADLDGYLGDLTERSIAAWQADHGYAETGALTQAQVVELFDGDPNVTVVVDTIEL